MSAKMRRNEQCWQTLDHDDTFKLIVGFQKFTVNSIRSIRSQITNSQSSLFLSSLHIKKLHRHILSDIWRPSSLKQSVMGASTLSFMKLPWYY